MNIEDYRIYCLSKKGVMEHFPFDQDTLVFKVLGKMFSLVSLQKWESVEGFINLKCDPEYAIELRENYSCIVPGFHANKKHWNTIVIESIDTDLILKWIDHSYQLVWNKLPNRLKG